MENWQRKSGSCKPYRPSGLTTKRAQFLNHGLPFFMSQAIEREAAIKLMLAAKVQNGSANLSFGMTPYVFSRRRDGTHVFNLGMCWEKIRFAARMIYAVENPADVLAVSSKPFGQRAVHKFAHFLGGNCINTRFTPGFFTNHSIVGKFMEPRLILVCDPNTDAQAIHEAAYANIPCIALCDTDAHLDYVDCVIPCNTKNKTSIGLVMWLLTREVLRLKGKLGLHEQWNVLPDLYFFRDARDEAAITEALENQGQENAPEEAKTATAPAPEIIGATEDEWKENKQ